MVKVFKRSDAGAAAQLPSDLRPPPVLKKTCDYLFDELLANASSPGDVHGFIWDRARAIRNDFSIQQVTKAEDMRIAIDCFERIARFHIASLHEFALLEKPYDGYVAQQEREQLDRTLLSLMQYYDDSRGRVELQNEPEFRAYCVVFQIQDPTPDLEDRVQSWPTAVSEDPRVRTALEIYTAAQGTKLPQGPMEPRQIHLSAQQHWEQFWALLRSRRVSFLLGCVAEVYFNLVREMALAAIVLSARPTRKKDGEMVPNAEWLMEELKTALGFDEDDDDDVIAFIAQFGLQQVSKDGEAYLDLREAGHKPLPERVNNGFPDQLRSQLVEDKRYGRTVTAVINGLSVRAAQDAGMILEEQDDDEEDSTMAGEENIASAEDGKEDEAEADANVAGDHGEGEDEDDEDSLFIPETRIEPPQPKPSAFSPFGAPASSSAQPFQGFGKPSASNADQSSKAESSTFFGKPSTTNPFLSIPPKAPDTQPTTTAAPAKSPFAIPPGQAPSSGQAKPLFSFGAPSGTALSTPISTDDTPQTPSRKAGPFTLTSPSPPSTTSQSAFSTTTTQAPPPLFNFPKTSDAPAAPPSLGSAPSAPSSSLQPQTNAPKAAPQSQAQPSNATSSLSSQTQNAALSDNTSHSNSNRRPSSSIGEHKPKHPSPLSQSFTASQNEDNSAVAGALQSKPPSARSKSSAAPIEPPPPIDPDAILSKLAHEVTLAPVGGILQQYVRYCVGQVIKQTQEKVRLELIEENLEELRLKILKWKFGRKWRDLYLRLRFQKKRSATRERAERRLRKSQAADIGGSVLGATTATTRRKGISSLARTDGTMADRTPRRIDDYQQARAGSKRPASTQAGTERSSIDHPESKRPRSMSHVDSRGAVSKPTPTSASAFKRSSFLGFSLGNNQTHRASTTKSTYFRMKALGLQSPSSGLKREHSSAESESARSTKRARSDSTGTGIGAVGLRMQSPALDSSAPKALAAIADSRSMPPPTPKSRDEDIFARLKAAREALKDNNFMKEEVDKDEELRNSLGNSQSSTESPSLAKARAEARLRSSLQGSSYADRNGPAYRSRQSKFLSAEEQARAIERAQVLRSSRNSRESSRPASRTETRTEELDFSKDPDRTQIASGPNGARNGDSLAHTSPFKAFAAPPNAKRSGEQPRNPFRESSSFAPPPATQNPFLQAGATPVSFHHHEAQHTSLLQNDHTIQPSQVNNVLSQSFGSPIAQATNGGSQPSQTTSYMPMQGASQTISLLSDDGEDVDDGDGADEETGNESFQPNPFSFGQAIGAPFNGFSGNGIPDSYQHSESGGEEDEVEGDYDEEVEYEEEWDDNPAPTTQPQEFEFGEEQEEFDDDEQDPNGVQEEDDMDADEEDEDGYGDEDDDGEIEYDDEEDDDEEGGYAQPPLNYAYNQRHRPPPKTFVPEGPGQSADDAIELSD